jgi:hypothetical protein
MLGSTVAGQTVYIKVSLSFDSKGRPSGYFEVNGKQVPMAFGLFYLAVKNPLFGKVIDATASMLADPEAVKVMKEICDSQNRSV